MKRNRRLCLAVVGAVLSASTFASAGADKPASGAVSALEKKYVVTETTPDFAQITKDGTTMSMKCPGVYSVPASLMMKPDTKVVDGKVQSPGMLTKMTWTKVGAHVLQSGEKVYITKIENKSEMTGDLLRFTVLTVDALDVSGSETKKKFEATISFKFKKGYLDETPPDQLEQTIESVLAPDTGEDAKGTETASAPAPAPAAAAPAAKAAPAPPPPPPGPAPTITIGESSTEVLQAMGMPQQMIDLGKKKTYVYKNMKIVFVNDKVSDVQ